MHIHERPVNISDRPDPRNINKPSDGVVCFSVMDANGNVTATVNQNVWINKPFLIERGMNWFTHRRIFRQIAKIGHGMVPVSLKIKTKEGIRVFLPDTYRSTLENTETK